MRTSSSIYERDHAASATMFAGIPDCWPNCRAQHPGRDRHRQGRRIGGDLAAAAGVGQHFDIVESGSPEGSVKPEAIRRIVEHWNLDPETVAYVGDAPNDVSEARAAGVIPLAAAWAATADRAALESRDPAAIFTAVAELADWIR